jgi:glycosyltransferase involved in cell wall biosynthesis
LKEGVPTGKTKMKISIIVGFRNRDIPRVKRSLDSLAIQSFTDFELIFIDYGSDLEIAQEAKKVVDQYGFATYVYNDTRGWFWNRAHALNTGIKIAKGEVCLFYDVDLILEIDFLRKVSLLDYKQHFYSFNCFYLPKEFNVDDKNVGEVGIRFDQNYVGLCAVHMEFVTLINGFDEYYMVWGVEDDDFYARLSAAQIQRKQMLANDFKVFHQWHPTQSPTKPNSWYLEMVNYLFSKTEFKDKIADRGTTCDSENRPLIQLLYTDINQAFTRLEFWNDRAVLFFNPFVEEFHRVKKGEKQYLEYKFFEEKKRKNVKEKIFGLFFKPNKNKGLIDRKDIIHFFQYFVGINRRLILDYYFQVGESSIRFYYVKN